ncbi:integrase core domain-containing protein [Streptomyces cinereoruber]|uniref:integrase core domain-containing protein n=1 Tax=Streptomyces cinereoruber TaxID=67260 RepID=UPI00365518BA
MSKGDLYDNALAEAFNSLFKAELIRNKGPWTGINDVEIAIAEYIDWFNQRRLHGELGHMRCPLECGHRTGLIQSPGDLVGVLVTVV